MRLGTRIAVINEANEILLSKRGDFGVWALPGGRVDSGELLHESAVREVNEETGLDVEIEQPVGLYFQQGRSRMNVLYRAKPIGGELYKATDETLDNRFFAQGSLPDDLFGKFYIDHAYSKKTYVYTIDTPFWELIKLDLKLRLRWIQNLLAGRPEPKFNHFTVRAVGVVWNDDKVLSYNGTLPNIVSNGQQALDQALSAEIGDTLNWQWVGLWQDPASDRMDFIFHAKGSSQPRVWIEPSKLAGYLSNYTKRDKPIWLLI